MNHPIERNRRRTPSEIKELLNRYRQSQLPQGQFVRIEGVCLASGLSRVNCWVDCGNYSGNHTRFIQQFSREEALEPVPGLPLSEVL